jgi:hypothetical protein
MRKAGKQERKLSFPAFLIQKACGFSMTLEQRQGAQEKRKARRLCVEHVCLQAAEKPQNTGLRNTEGKRSKNHGPGCLRNPP